MSLSPLRDGPFRPRCQWANYGREKDLGVQSIKNELKNDTDLRIKKLLIVMKECIRVDPDFKHRSKDPVFGFKSAIEAFGFKKIYQII